MIGIIIGALMMILLFNFEDLKRAFKQYFLNKRYKRLSSGIPKRVVGLKSFDDIWWKKKLPLYIEEETYTLNYRWFHCNDEHVVIENEYGEQFRLECRIVSSVRLAKDRWSHKRAIYMKSNYCNQTTFVGRFVKPDAILEVY
jgi:hypothetical protein